ncbi:MAG TPA: hypothetical protein VK129_04385 [Terriglobales bacterium]|nr:hypothetical protein [Terriglobales bacterium]
MKNRISVFLLSGVAVCGIVLPGFGQGWKRHSRSAASQTAMAAAIPAGTSIRVRMIESLNSESAQVGQAFHATLEDAIVVNGQMLFPRNSDVVGSVAEVHRSGRLSDPGMLKLVLSSVTSGSQSTTLTVAPIEIKGESHTTSNVEKIGGGTAVGAIIGGIAGGGKGAAIGAGAGAAAGTGVAAATGKREAKVQSEAVFTWTTIAAPSTASSNMQPVQNAANTPANSNAANAGGAQTQASDPNASRSFSAHDRRVIRNCVEDSKADLPPGLAKRDSLPPGLEKQMDRNGTLPPGLQKRVRPLPQACEQQLPPLPNDLERVIYGGRVMLIDTNNRILDKFFLDEE